MEADRRSYCFADCTAYAAGLERESAEARATAAQMRSSLESCLSVLLRMIPEACEEHRLPACSQREHDRAIKAAAIALYGRDRRRWPPGAQRAARGGYA